MKEQNKTPEKELNKMETSNLLGAEFETLILRTLNGFSGRVVVLRENFNSIKKDTETPQKGHENYKKEPVRNEGYTN